MLMPFEIWNLWIIVNIVCFMTGSTIEGVLTCHRPSGADSMNTQTGFCSSSDSPVIRRIFGKNFVFAMTIKLIPEFWRNQEIPEKFWKIYEQVKLDLFQNFYLFLIINSRILPSQAPTNHPTILLDILCLANLNGIFFFSWVLL